MSIMSRHIPFDRLADLAEGRLSPDEQEAVHAHAANCSRCAPQLKWLEHVIGLMRTGDFEDPPAHLADRVNHAFTTYGPPPRASLRDRIRAVLNFDSALQPALLGRRSVSSADRQLLFTAGSLDLELRIAREDELWEISGQILNADVQGTAELRGEAGIVRALVNEIGEFLLAPVPAGTYTLILLLTTEEVEIPDIQIGA